jgi:hypothetical protein
LQGHNTFSHHLAEYAFALSLMNEYLHSRLAQPTGPRGDVGYGVAAMLADCLVQADID